MPQINKPSNLSKTWARNGEKREPNDSKKDLGWIAEIPTYQDFNWLDNRQDEAIAHINQLGIAEWDSTTEYQVNKSYVQGSNGNVYLARQTNINQNPVLDTSYSYWGLVLSSQNYFQPEIPLTLINNFSNHVSFPVLKAFVNHSTLFINGAVRITTTVTGNVVATLPANYRPMQNRLAIASWDNGATASGTVVVLINTAGEIILNQGNWNTLSNNIIFSIGVPF